MGLDQACREILAANLEAKYVRVKEEEIANLKKQLAEREAVINELLEAIDAYALAGEWHLKTVKIEGVGKFLEMAVKNSVLLLEKYKPR